MLYNPLVLFSLSLTIWWCKAVSSPTVNPFFSFCQWPQGIWKNCTGNRTVVDKEEREKSFWKNSQLVEMDFRYTTVCTLEHEQVSVAATWNESFFPDIKSTGGRFLISLGRRGICNLPGWYVRKKEQHTIHPIPQRIFLFKKLYIFMMDWVNKNIVLPINPIQDASSFHQTPSLPASGQPSG